MRKDDFDHVPQYVTWYHEVSVVAIGRKKLSSCVKNACDSAAVD